MRDAKQKFIAVDSASPICLVRALSRHAERSGMLRDIVATATSRAPVERVRHDWVLVEIEPDARAGSSVSPDAPRVIESKPR